MSEDPIKDCPSCGKPAAKRQITSANFILKGGGWYSDLYSGGSNKKSDAPKAGGEAGTSATGDAKSSSGDGAASKSANASPASSSSSTESSAPSTPSTATKS
jgi:predicted nucleic acid-binding Zn ribbon protein